LISNNYSNFNNIKPSLFQPDSIKQFHNNLNNDPSLSTNLMKKNDFNINILNKNPNLYNNYNSNNVIQFFPHKIGLQNIGQACYMNATIQCLSNIQPLTEYLMSYNFMFQNPLFKPLTIFYFDLLKNLFFPSPEVKFRGYYAPYNFKQIIGKMNPLFQGFHPADSKDLLFFILETLHEELNFVNKNMNMNFNIFNIDSSNEQSVFQWFMNDFNLKNNSIITSLFYGINESILKCLGCGKITYSFQAYNLIVFPLLDVFNYKRNKEGLHDIKDINIYDAFESMNKEENFMIYCNHCQNLCKAYHQKLIYMTPRILIIVLNRGKNNMEYQGNFEFGSELDLTKILVNKNNQFKKYFLIGVITHLEESGDNGHFIAYCRNKQREYFHCYDDESVYKLNKNDDVYGKNQLDNISNKKTPYILFYQSIN
jgi:ubiquitin C-terminal hydrolase